MTWESFYLAPDRVISYPLVGKVENELRVQAAWDEREQPPSQFGDRPEFLPINYFVCLPQL